MTLPPEKITIRCPNCGKQYQDWLRPSASHPQDHFDDHYLEDYSFATCPVCGFRVSRHTLVMAKDGTFVFHQ